MANRYPLIVDSSSENIKELPAGDGLLFADNDKIVIGTGSDLTLYHDASNSYITNAIGALKIATETSGIAVTIGHTTSETTIADNLTVTGTLTGTLATAAQGSVTSLGTLTALTIDNLGINGNTITANSGAVNITPAAGSAIVLDGTINVDAGVVTGATSITSTAFVGDITGTASTVTVTDNAANTNYPVVYHNGSNALLDHAASLNYNPGTETLSVPTLDIGGNVDIDGILETDNLTVGGSQGSDGQVLTSTGSGVGWEDAGGGTTLTGSTNNTVTTVTGSDAIQGEANLTFDGSTLDVNGNLDVDATTGVALVVTNSTLNNLVARFDQIHASSPYGIAIDFENAAPDNQTNYFLLCLDSSNSSKMSIFSNGQVQTPGVLFGTDTAAANALDDYEEGTWTPTTGPGSSQGYAYRSGNYTKVGRLVTAYFGLKHNAGTFTSGEAVLGGLPYTIQTTGPYQEPEFRINLIGNCPTGITGGVGDSDSLIPGQVAFYLAGGQSEGRGRKCTVNADSSLPADEIFDSDSFIIGSAIYYTT